MTPRTGSRRRHGQHSEHGQMIVLFALCLVAIIAVAGLLIDGGMAWSNRRQAQAAADTAALAAAKAVVAGSTAQDAANAVAAANGVPADLVNCDGSTTVGGGVLVHNPPISGPHTGEDDYVEVVTTRRMTTTFSGALGMSCWMVSARAVSSIGTASVAQCSFCSLNGSSGNHTLVLKNGATLRVDGDIYVNSTNGGTTGPCTPVDPGSGMSGMGDKWEVCGDGFDIFGDGGQITARTISVAGGWETHDGNPTQADYRALVSDGAGGTMPCPLAPDPWQQTAPWIPSNVCIHMPQIADPLNDSVTPENQINPPTSVGPPVAGVNGCPAGAVVPSGGRVTIATAGTVICPGTYNGGIKITGNGSAMMMPGVYYMAGGGFEVSGAASVDGTAGVMIYNTSGDAGASNTNPGTDLVPASTPGLRNAKEGKLKATPNKAETFEDVVLKFDVKVDPGPAPTGVMSFFNGSTVIPGCENLPVTSAASGMGTEFTATASCTVSFATSGSKGLSAVYYGDAVFNPIGDAVIVNITVAAGGQVNINTSGSVQLYGPTSGPYKGLTIFQNRTSSATIVLHPGSGSGPDCDVPTPGIWLTQDVPDVDGVDPPPACGAIGGLRGTIYAADPDALVFITASGLANLQVIAGKIQIDSDADARFAYTPQFFANGNIRLIE